MKTFASEKKLVRDYMEKLENCAIEEIGSVLDEFVSEDYTWEGSYPFMDLTGSKAVCDTFWTPLKKSLHRIQRRQDVFMAGLAKDGKTWVMSMGQFMGRFMESFLNIPRTTKIQHLHYYEFSLIENNKIVHTALYCDIIAFMTEAGLNVPMLETGKYFVYPGPRDHNGLLFGDCPKEKSIASMATVDQMIDDLYKLDCADPKVLARTWSEDMLWYGPCGVGACFTIEGYKQQHSKPFRDHLADRKSLGRHAFFSEDDFVCFYTNLSLSSPGGWMGLCGGAKDIILRGDLDIYYCKDGKILENWCYFDIPYWMYQQGVDIIERTVSICNP